MECECVSCVVGACVGVVLRFVFCVGVCDCGRIFVGRVHGNEVV